MRELLGVGVIAMAFGMLASFASEEPGWFALANFGVGTAALVLGALRALVRAPAWRG